MRVTFYDYGYGMLGVQYNMACLAAAGHEVDLFYDHSMTQDHMAQDFSIAKFLSYTFEEVCAGLMRQNPDMVCFSIPTYNYKQSIALIKELKKAQPNLIIATGGTHPTLLPKVMLRHPEVDFVVVGEGEYAFPKLVKDIETHGLDRVKAMPRDAHPGCWNTHDGEVIDRGMAPTVKNLDEIPYPEKRLHYEANPALIPMYTTMSSRGCVFTCSFCNSASLNEKFREEGDSKFYRMRSVDNVIEELRWAKEHYKAKYIQFVDDIFGVKRSWLKEFSEKYKKEVGLPFEIQTNPKIHNEESMKLLADCGCVHLEFGFQSANAEIRREMLSRKETNEEVKELIAAARSRGMLMELDLILNLPGETEAEVREAIEFVESVTPELVNVSYLQYFPKTPIIKTALKHGILKEEDLAKIEEGDMISSMHLINQHGAMHKRYRILPLQMYIAAHYPLWLSRPMNRFVEWSFVRDIFAYFGSWGLYLTRSWVAMTDWRDFFHRRQIPRTLYSARAILMYKFVYRRLRPRRILDEPTEVKLPAVLHAQTEAGTTRD